MRIFFFLLLFIMPVLLNAPARAEESLVTYQALTPELAMKAAAEAMRNCRAAGYQVTAAVVDRGGNVQALVRDRYAGPHTPETARRKAWTATSFRTNTTEMAVNTGPDAVMSGARQITDALMLGGGIIIEAGDGSLLGAIGVSGAPGGDLDDACAEAGIEAIADSLMF